MAYGRCDCCGDSTMDSSDTHCDSCAVLRSCPKCGPAARSKQSATLTISVVGTPLVLREDPGFPNAGRYELNLGTFVIEASIAGTKPWVLFMVPTRGSRIEGYMEGSLPPDTTVETFLPTLVNKAFKLFMDRMKHEVDKSGKRVEELQRVSNALQETFFEVKSDGLG